MDSQKATMFTNGVTAFNEQRYVDSIRYYSEALELVSESPQVIKNEDLLWHRSVCFLEIGCCILALCDAERILNQDTENVKAVDTKVKSLWGLRKFKEALEFLASGVGDSVKKAPEYTYLCTQSQKIFKQSNGEYDMLEFIQYPAEKRLQAAPFIGPVEILQVANKGRGLVAKKEIQAGELIILSKAYSIVFGCHERWTDPNERVNLIVKTIANKLRWQIQSRIDFCNLSAGPNTTKHPNWLLKTFERIDAVGNAMWIDNELEDEIKREIFNRLKTNAYEYSNRNEGSYGIWITPSYINHTCFYANANIEIFGDMMMIRATKKVSIGQEILVSYKKASCKPNPDSMLITLDNFNFNCVCEFCLIKTSRTNETVTEILHTWNDIMSCKNENSLKSLQNQYNQLVKLSSLPNGISYMLISEVEGVAVKLFEASQYVWTTKILQLIRRAAYEASDFARVLYIDYILVGCYTFWKQPIEGWINRLFDDLAMAYGKEVNNWSRSKKIQAVHAIFTKHGMEECI